MTGNIRLGCGSCDREDYDFVTGFPNDWTDITQVRSYEESSREVAFDDETRSALDWQTHLGTCPDCQALEEQYGP